MEGSGITSLFSSDAKSREPPKPMPIHADPDPKHCRFLKMSYVRNLQFYYLLPGDRIGRVQEFLSGEVLQVDLIKLKIGTVERFYQLPAGLFPLL
jgi:hypothetical protein